MTKPCPICKRQLTKQGQPTPSTAHAVNMFGKDSHPEGIMAIGRFR
jgi:hypothetical protein